MIFRQNKKNIHIFTLFESFHALVLNACLFFHSGAFESSLIVPYEFLSCPLYEKDILAMTVYTIVIINK